MSQENLIRTTPVLCSSSLIFLAPHIILSFFIFKIKFLIFKGILGLPGLFLSDLKIQYCFITFLVTFKQENETYKTPFITKLINNYIDKIRRKKTRINNYLPDMIFSP